MDIFLSIPVLCFVLGILAGVGKSDLQIPDSMGRGLAIYLMLAIGLKGGHTLALQGWSWHLLPALGTALLASFALPFLAFGLLSVLVPKLPQVDKAAISAHYGSVSIVTFAAALEFLQSKQVDYEGALIAMLALMETPAILAGILLARRNNGKEERHPLGLSLLSHGSVLLLLGGLVTGWLTSSAQYESVVPFFETGFKGALCLFLLDMGLLVARRFVRMPARLLLFGIVMPLIGSLIGLGLGLCLDLSVGGCYLLAVLVASSSYIAVPAAMRISLPEANPGLYVGLSLGVTFPFNVLVGIWLYYWLVAGGG